MRNLDLRALSVQGSASVHSPLAMQLLRGYSIPIDQLPTMVVVEPATGLLVRVGWGFGAKSLRRPGLPPGLLVDAKRASHRGFLGVHSQWHRTGNHGLAEFGRLD